MTKDEERKLFEEFVKSHPELKKVMNKMKYDALIELFMRDELWGGDTSKRDGIVRYFTIFRDADVDADVVLQATMALMDQPPESADNIKECAENFNDIRTGANVNMSEAELTAFVNTLNKIRKQGDQDVGDNSQEDS